MRKELLRALGAETPEGEQSCQFRHRLMQDAAYRRIAKQVRAELHERYADWLRTSADARVDDTEALVGHHLEAAYRYRTELREIDHARALARDAGERLAVAGHRLVMRGDASALPLLVRAVALLSKNDAVRREALLDLAGAASGVGQDRRAAQAYNEALDAATRAGDERRATHARLGLLEVQWFYSFQGLIARGREQVETARRTFERLGDVSGQAKAWRLLAYIQAGLGRSRAAEAASEQAIEAAGLAGDELLQARSRRLHCFILDWGPTPIDDVTSYCEDFLAWTQDHGMPSLGADALNILGRAAAMRGDFAGARSLIRRAKEIAKTAEILIWAGEEVTAAQVELLDDKPDNAERAIRPAYEDLLRIGAKGSLSTVSALLARALLLQGRDEEAAQAIRICRTSAAEKQLEAQIKWRELRAVLAVRRGQLAMARQLADEAVSLAMKSEQLDTQAQAHVDLAAVCQAAGQLEQARAAAQAAVDCYRKKGNLVSAEKATGLVDELTAPSAQR